MADSKNVMCSLRVPADLHKKVIKYAKTQHRSFTSMCLYYIEQGLKKDLKKGDRDENG